MLDVIVLAANVATAMLTYHFITHNVIASVVGFTVGMLFWVVFRSHD